MFNVRDLFQWERFITPSLIRVFYWLAVIIALVAGLSGLATALGMARLNPLMGAVMAVASVAGTFIAIIGARIAAEFVLIMFRINEHLGVLRSRAEM